MAGLYDASRLAQQAGPNGVYGLSLRARGPTDEDAQTALEAAYSPTIMRGLRMGAQGALSGATGYGAAVLDALGKEKAAQEWYAAANERARQAALMGPEVQQWSQVHDLPSFIEYGIGQMGAAAPMLAPAVAGGGLASALRLGPVATTAAAAAPMMPTLAGGQALAMHEDPATMAASTPEGRLGAATVSGGLQAGLLGLVPGYMTARALGVPGAAAKATVNPLRAAGGIAADTGLSAAAQGAAGVGAGEIGRAFQRGYNPAYEPPGGVDEARAEEFWSNAIGALPMVAPLAVTGRVLGAHVEPGKNIAGVAADKAKQAAGAALDKGMELGGAALDKGKEALAATAPAVAAAKNAAQDAYHAGVVDALVNGASPDEAMTAGVGRSAEAGAQEAFKPIGMMAGRLFRAATESLDNFTSSVMEKFHEQGKKPTEAEFHAAVRDEQLSVAAVLRNIAMQSGDTKQVELLDRLNAKLQSGSLTGDDAKTLQMLAEGAARKHREQRPLEWESTQPPAEGTYSKANDVFHGTTRKLLTESGYDADTVKKITNRLGAKDIERRGVTRAIREALDAVGADENTRKLVSDKLYEPLKALKDEHYPDVHELGQDHAVEAFRDEATPIVNEMIRTAGRDISEVEHGKAVNAIVDFFQLAAKGDKEHAANVPKLVKFLDSIGGDTNSYIKMLVDRSKVLFGEDSKQFKRVSRLTQEIATEESQIAPLRDLVSESALNHFGRRSESGAPRAALLADHMVGGLREAEAIRAKYGDLRAKNKAQLASAEERLAAAMKRGNEEAMRSAEQEVRTLRSEKLKLDNAESQFDLERMMSYRWKGIVKPKRVNEAITLVAKRGGMEHLLQPETKSVHDNYGAKQGARQGFDEQLDDRKMAESIDPDTADKEQPQTDAEEIAAKREGETATQGEEAPREYIGRWSLNPTGRAPTVDVPITRKPTAAHPKGEGSEALARTTYGHRLADARFLNVVRWAEDRAMREGGSLHSLLNEALTALLKSDKERRTELANKGHSDEVEAIDKRAAMAEKLLGGKKPENAGYEFFNHGENKHLGYYRVEQETGANISRTAQQLWNSSVGENPPEVAGYAANMAQRNPTFPAKVYERSVVPIKMKDGTAHVDVAREVQMDLSHHQIGDSAGVGDKEAPAPAVDHRFGLSQHTPQEILYAFYNWVSTIYNTKGVADDPFSLATQSGALKAGYQEPTTQMLPGRNRSERDLPFFARDLVIYRDIESGRAFTIGQLEKMQELNPKTMAPTPDRLMIDAKTRAAMVQPTKATTKSDTYGSSQREATIVDTKRGADNGVLIGALVDKDGVKHDVNLREVLRFAAEKHDIDFGELMRDSDVPDRLVSELLREGLHELMDTQGFKFRDDVTGKRYDAHAAAKVLMRSFGDEPATPLTWGKLRLDDAVSDKMPRGIEAAKIASSEERLRKVTDTLDAWNENRKKGIVTRDAVIGRALMKENDERLARQLSFLVRNFDPMDAEAKNNKYAASDIENSMIAGVLRDLGGVKDAALFDRSTQQLFLRAAESLENKTYGDLAARADMRTVEHAMHKEDQRQAALTDETGVGYRGRGLTEPPNPRAGWNVGQTDFIDIRSPDDVSMRPMPKGRDVEETAPPTEWSQPGAPTGEGQRPAWNAFKTDAMMREAGPPAPAGKAATTTDRVQLTPTKEGTLRLPNKSKDYGNWVDPNGETKVPVAPAEAPKATFEAIHADMTDGKTPSASYAHQLIRSLDDETLYRLATELPNKGRTVKQEQFANVLGSAYKERLNKMGLEFDSKWKSFNSVDDQPFSMAKAGEGPKDVERTIAYLKGEHERMLGDLSKLDIVSGMIDGKAVGKHIDAKKATDSIMHTVVSLMAEDARGAHSHETWHAVREGLEAMGEAGKKILDTVERSVDTPMMKAWLERVYANDEGALKQIRESSREREAYAFQAFRNGKAMPLAPETRTVWRRIGDFLNGLLKKVGLNFTGDAERANAFFKHVSDGGYLRDHKNAAALLNALGETKSDKYGAALKELSKPVMETMDTLVGHTGERIRQMGNAAYDELRKRFEGDYGKGGYTLWRRQALQRFANSHEDAFGKLRTPDERRKFFATPEGGKALEAEIMKLREYAKHVPAEEFRAIEDSIYTIDPKMASDRFEELVADLKQYGGLHGMSDGAIRDVASKFADSGFAEGVNPFKDNPKQRIKWRNQDEMDGYGRLVETVVDRNERRAAKVEQADIEQLLEEGAKTATADQQQFMAKAVDAYQHRLGHDKLSPEAKKLMSALLVANNARILPFALFSQFLEPVQVAFRKNDMSAAFGTLFRNIAQLPRTFEALDKNYTPSYFERLAKELGTAAPISSMLSDMHTGFHIGGKIGKLNDLFFRYTGQEAWNRAMTIEATRHAEEFLREHSGNQQGFVPGKHSERFLKELGLTKDMVEFHPDGKINLDGKHGDAVRKAMMQFVHEAMAYPDPGSSPLWMNDARFTLLAQFKRFMFAHNRYILQRGEREWKHGNFRVALPYLSAVPWMITADALRDSLTGSGAYKQNWGVTDYLTNGLERSGAFGRGQIINDALNSVKHGGKGYEPALGPTFELAGRLAQGLSEGNLSALVREAPGGPLIMPD